MQPGAGPRLYEDDHQSAANRHDSAHRPRVLIAHDFTETYGGAERIITAAAAVLPEAPFWTIAGRSRSAGAASVTGKDGTGRREVTLPETGLDVNEELKSRA